MTTNTRLAASDHTFFKVKFSTIVEFGSRALLHRNFSEETIERDILRERDHKRSVGDI
jgi:hypothetical protein